MQEGVDGLLRDKTRKPGKAPLPVETVRRVVDLTLSAPPGETTHWTGRMLAKAVGISLRALQRIWEAHGLQPHRVRTFKRSNDPAVAEKVEDIVGLYMDPPTPSCCRSMRSRKFRRSTSPNLACRSSRASAGLVCQIRANAEAAKPLPPPR